MILKEELILLLDDIESSRIERTISENNTEKFSQAVCAFANDLPNTGKPGYLVIGADDRNGRPCGLNITDQLLRNLGELRASGNILPIPSISIAKFDLERGDVAVVEVLPSDMPPVRYRGQVWVRIGPRKAVASEQEERLLTEKRRIKAQSFDAWPSTDAALKDLSSRLFAEYRSLVVAPEIIAENHCTIEEQMASLRFFDMKSNCPTMAGILMFGTNPRYYFSCGYTQFLRFPGTVMTDIPIDQMEMNGTIPAIAELSKGKIQAYNRSLMKHGDDLRDILNDDYPEWAIREFLHNALIHRDYQANTPVRFYWYEDRIEIQNPGGFYGGQNTNQTYIPGAYRNPILAEGMKVLGYVNRFGFGIQNAQKMLEKNGNPLAEIISDQHTVLVIIRKRSQ
jgi:ATP-dependent DNA helicase RecG